MWRGVQCARPSSTASFTMLVRRSWSHGCSPLVAPSELVLLQSTAASWRCTPGLRSQLHSLGLAARSFIGDKPQKGVSKAFCSNSRFLGRSIHLQNERRMRISAHPSLAATAALSNSDDTLTLEEPSAEPEEEVRGPRIKKKVAMWVGYVGTRYKGTNHFVDETQVQEDVVKAYKFSADRVVLRVSAIEEELERAIYKAGGIIESNFGNLAKISWTRSSRTDKGVHSLCTVISMKMEVPASAWVKDMDGLALADSINVHLPRFIRVFGIVPVTRSFRARHDCCTRTYNYLLPAAIIDIHPNTSTAEVEQRVENFQSILRLFELRSEDDAKLGDLQSSIQLKGKHAYHNYTIRRLYRHFPQKPFRSRQSDRSDSNSNGSLDRDDIHTGKASTNTIREEIFVDAELGLFDEEDITDELADILAGELADEMLTTFAEESRGEKNVHKTLTAAAAAGGELSARRAWWLPTPDESDKVWSSHFRKVLSCSCGMPETSADARFISISITGSSFMVHQIRKMIGTAVAVFRGLLPRDSIPISLARHSRIVLPLAPPDGLILVSNDFMPFRIPPIHQKKSDIEANIAPVVRRREDLPKLEMAEAIMNRADEFCRNVLMSEVAPMVSEDSPNWSAWMANLERNVRIPESEMAVVRAAWTEWREQSVRLRQMRNQIDEEWRDLPKS